MIFLFRTQWPSSRGGLPTVEWHGRVPPPMDEQPRGVAHVRVELYVRAAVGEPDHGVRAAEDLRHRLGVGVVLAEREERVQLFLHGQVEDSVGRSLAPLV